MYTNWVFTATAKCVLFTVPTLIAGSNVTHVETCVEVVSLQLQYNGTDYSGHAEIKTLNNRTHFAVPKTCVCLYMYITTP